jgi:hypothetical protein
VSRFRKSKIRISKTRIRHLFRQLAQGGVDEIDQFREHVRDACAERQRILERRAERLAPDAQEFLGDEASELDNISCLADQLSIVALYRIVEINTGRMLAHEFGKPAEKAASYIGELKKLLKAKKGIDLIELPHYRAIEQLRLLSNDIKHGDQRWYEVKNRKTLEKAYARLSPKVPAYIFRLAERMKLQYRSPSSRAPNL